MAEPTVVPSPRLIARSRDRRIAGVAGGVAEHVGWEPWRVRLLGLLTVALLGRPGLAAYVVLAVLMPAPPPPAPGEDVRVTGFWARVAVAVLVVVVAAALAELGDRAAGAT